MIVSVGTNNVKFEPVKLDIQEFVKIAMKKNWSPSVFKNNYRSKDNFITTETIGLDIDDGLSLDEAVKLFKNYKHVIMTTKSHQIEKNGVTTDRFRVLLFLDGTIDNIQDYYTTWFQVLKEFPFIDQACKDPSRYYYPSTQVISLSATGKEFNIKKYVKPELTVVGTPVIEIEGRGVLSKKSMQFFLNGEKRGARNPALFKASKDAQEQGYTQEEIVQMLNSMIARTGNWASKEANKKDKETIASAFKEEPKYEKRVETKAFNFNSINQLMEDKPEVNWLVGDLVTEGGISILAGKPKSGKSTIARQMSLAISRGDDFLGRPTKKGKVLYLALEEQEAMIYEQFNKLGATGDDDIFIHVGAAFRDDFFSELTDILENDEVRLLVIDTLFLLANLQDGNNYDTVNKELTKFRELARKTNTHIMAIHHQNKSLSKGTDSISGSVAIHGAVDCAMIFNTVNDRRFISSSQRGGKRFDSNECFYDADTDSYTIGQKVTFNDEF